MKGLFEVKKIEGNRVFIVNRSISNDVYEIEKDELYFDIEEDEIKQGMFVLVNELIVKDVNGKKQLSSLYSSLFDKEFKGINRQGINEGTVYLYLHNENVTDLEIIENMISRVKLKKEVIRRSLKEVTGTMGEKIFRSFVKLYKEIEEIKKDTGIDTSSAGRLLCDDLEPSCSTKLRNFLSA